MCACHAGLLSVWRISVPGTVLVRICRVVVDLYGVFGDAAMLNACIPKPGRILKGNGLFPVGTNSDIPEGHARQFLNAPDIKPGLFRKGVKVPYT